MLTLPHFSIIHFVEMLITCSASAKLPFRIPVISYLLINTCVGKYRTFNYLSENNLLNYEDFQQHVSDIDASVKAAEQRITQIDSELSTQKLIQKHCDSYRLCRKVIEDCKSTKNPKAYRTKHQAEYQLHDSLKKELQDLGVTKIPSSNKIQKRIENLESEQAATVREKRNCRKSKRHWISSDKISLHCSMLLRSVQTYFQQNGNLFLSQEINRIALTTQLFFSKSSQGFRSISSQVTPYGAPTEIFTFGLCQLSN